MHIVHLTSYMATYTTRDCSDRYIYINLHHVETPDVTVKRLISALPGRHIEIVSADATHGRVTLTWSNTYHNLTPFSW